MERRQFDDTKNKQTLENAFSGARTALINAPFEPAFQQLCQTNGVHAGDHQEPVYWELMEQYQWDKSQDETLSGFESYAQAIAGCTPNAIMHQIALNSNHSEQAHNHKIALSGYNTLIRDFAANYPETSVIELTSQLQKVAHVTIAGDSRRVQTEADYLLRNILRGAQHELGFRSILDASGLDYRTTSVEEDLKGGDFIVTMANGKEIKIDVKASLSEIDNKNKGSNNLPYYVSNTGNLVIFSCLTDTNFGDTFSINKKTAELRVPILIGALKDALKHLPRRNAA